MKDNEKVICKKTKREKAKIKHYARERVVDPFVLHLSNIIN